MGRLGASNSASLDFTDGDTFKRFTVADALVEAGSKLSVTIQRSNTADEDDAGWSYHPNVVSVIAGSFDVNVCALVLGEPPINDECPNETVTLTYLID